MVPQFITGSADLFGSTKNYLKEAAVISAATDPQGRNIWFGIREHAMGAILNGIAYDGLFRASGATFLVFADYMRGRSAWRPSRTCRWSTFSPTTRSASARTGRPTSRSRPSRRCA
jgi:transketolase